MDNRTLEEEIKIYQNNYGIKTPVKKKKTYDLKKILTGLGVIVFIVLLVLIFKMMTGGNEYSKLEKSMVSKAEEYIEKVNPSLSYVDISKLEIDIPKNCNQLSGVFYENSQYTPYLLCDDYESKIEETESNIVLNGQKIILLTKGSSYYELGYVLADGVQISGTVNTSKEGVYNVYYIPRDGKSYAVRKVVVVDNPSVLSLVPTITIDSNVELSVGQSYNNKVTATDKTDGDITSKIIKIDNVKNEVGSYSKVYSVTNSLGYTTMKSQNIVVLDTKEEEETTILVKISNENMTNQNVSINVKVVGGKYSYMTLPDGSTTEDMEIDYDVIENGTYEFVAVNKDQTKVYKKVKIDNIDKTLPTGTCSALIYSNKTTINVNVTSFNYIVEYKYIVNDRESEGTTKTSYTLNSSTTKDVYVKIKDYIGNENKITCTKEKKYNYDPQGYRKVLTQPARLTIPITQALAKKGYTFEQFNKCIYDRVVEAGPYTRYGVAAAAYGLIECSYTMTGYRLPYSHTASMVGDEKSCRDHADICGKLGASPRWGSPGGQCGVKSDGTKPKCYQGHNCATFVHWSMCNGGMDLCSRGDNTAFGMADIKFFPEADAVGIKGSKVTYVYGVDYSKLTAAALVRMLKPGDIIASSEGDGHVFVVVGYDNNGIYTAEDGYFMRNLTYATLTNGKESYRLMFLDRYYANPKNYNYLYG